jgi:DNA repair exonuclease SbcCD ATPase subunit
VATHPSFLARTDDADSPATKLAECDESLSLIAADVEQLTTDLERIRAGASPLARWLAERDAVLAEKELELTRLENERLAAQRRAEDAAAALRDTRDLLDEHDGRVTSANQELDDLRSRLAERDRRLEDAERERAFLDVALAERAEELERREAEVRAATVPAAVDDPEPVAGHVLYAPFAERYRLVASDEPCPKPGEVCDLDGRSFVVTRVGRSPFPADRRPCAFLQLRTAAA